MRIRTNLLDLCEFAQYNLNTRKGERYEQPCKHANNY